MWVLESSHCLVRVAHCAQTAYINNIVYVGLLLSCGSLACGTRHITSPHKNPGHRVLTGNTLGEHVLRGPWIDPWKPAPWFPWTLPLCCVTIGWWSSMCPSKDPLGLGCLGVPDRVHCRGRTGKTIPTPGTVGLIHLEGQLEEVVTEGLWRREEQLGTSQFPLFLHLHENGWKLSHLGPQFLGHWLQIQG